MRVFSSLAESGIAGIPVIIPAFNNPTYVRGMIAQLLSRGLRNIVVIDNGSTAPNMRESFLGASAVVLLSENRGPRYCFQHDREFEALPDLFCLTDPDLSLNPNLPENFLAELTKLTEEFQIGKVGFGLDISDPEAMRQDTFKNKEPNGEVFCKIWEWEQRFWNNQIASTVAGDPIYRASIDTTFALYNKTYFRRHNVVAALRVGGRYTCKHLPWYVDSGIGEDEAIFYASTQKFSHYSSSVPTEPQSGQAVPAAGRDGNR